MLFITTSAVWRESAECASNCTRGLWHRCGRTAYCHSSIIAARSSSRKNGTVLPDTSHSKQNLPTPLSLETATVRKRTRCIVGKKRLLPIDESRDSDEYSSRDISTTQGQYCFVILQQVLIIMNSMSVSTVMDFWHCVINVVWSTRQGIEKSLAWHCHLYVSQVVVLYQLTQTVWVGWDALRAYYRCTSRIPEGRPGIQLDFVLFMKCNMVCIQWKLQAKCLRG